MSTLNIVTAAAIPIAYLASRKAKNQPWLQQATVVGLWAAYLSSIQRDEEAFYLNDKMIESVLTFIMPLKLTQLILYDNRQEEIESHEQDQQPWWKDFLSFVGSFFYYALPISKSKLKEPPTFPSLLLRNAEYLLGICIKLMALPILEASSRKLMAENPEAHLLPNNGVYWLLLAHFCVSAAMGTWMLDAQAIVVNLVTLGRYEMLPMNNYPLQSRSTASLAAFAVSGILHSWVAYFMFGRGLIRACVYFVIQNPWITFERSDTYKNLPRFVGGFLSLLFFIGTMPIYGGLFVEGYPTMFEKNDESVPRDLPFLSNVSQWCLENLLHVQPEYWYKS
ncbi:expressed unknown protein [Seminavis robusta]|uniref:Wax synthase domain-containing protein n=1 Tax=Seminavis robusta TaxID=568900 RepID=A0A9N8H507_9STRA|nr:expressed unknown protein [Seminavis robusta]|eukprot:Sro75_g041090.1 n/a (336) ;mRNA; f:39406-40498